MSARRDLPALALGLLVVAALAALHVSVGAKPVPLATLWQAVVAFDPRDFDHVILRELRLPRAILAAVVGATLAVAGALMQGVTRNPLAEPGLLGLTAGAAAAVVLVVGVFRLAPPAAIPLVAAAGALGAALVVWLVAARAPGGATPLTLVLAGAAVTAFLGALTAAANLVAEESFETLRVWLSGSLAGRDLSLLASAGPFALLGLGIGLGLAPQVTALAMGDDTAVGLGVRVERLRALVLVAVIALTASAVALAGPLGFVGLVIPHAVRLLVGADYRRIVPFSAVAGAGYLLVVDIAARVALRPVEVSTGIVTALLGAPFFVWLVRARL